MKAAYPVHLEIFKLRLMAAVTHSLWEKGDRNPLILPSMDLVQKLDMGDNRSHDDDLR